MFLGNNVAAAAYACVAAIGGLAQAAAAQSAHEDAGHLERADKADLLCLQQCAQSGREPEQQAAMGTVSVAVVAAGGACLPVRAEPAVARIALAAQAAGPPLPILFCSLLN